MKRFTIKRLNLIHDVKFELHSLTHFSKTLIELKPAIALSTTQTAQETKQVATTIKRIAQAAFASLIIMVPVAEAHADGHTKSHAKAAVKTKRKIVSFVFDDSASRPAVEKNQSATQAQGGVDSQAKIVRTVKPLDRYSDDSADKDVEADVSGEDIEPIKSVQNKKLVAAVPKVHKPIRADAGISDNFLDEQNTQATRETANKPMDLKLEVQEIKSLENEAVESVSAVPIRASINEEQSDVEDNLDLFGRGD